MARLKTSESVGRGNISLNDAAAVKLELKPRSSVQLRVLRLPELPPTEVTVFVQSDTDPPTSTSAIQQAFLALTHSNPALALNSGAMLPLTIGPDRVTGALVELRFDSNAAVDETLLEGSFDSSFCGLLSELCRLFPVTWFVGVPTGALEKYAVLGSRSGSSLSIEQIRVQAASGTALQVLAELNSRQRSLEPFEQSALQLSRSAKAYSELKRSVRPVLFSDGATCRVLLGTKPPGFSLLYGDRGSGKSTLLRSLVEDLESDPACLAHGSIMDCRNLRGLKMESVKSRLSDLFDEAFACAPAVIVLDNLDALVPEEDESAGPANDQSRRIAELLVVLMNRANDKLWKTTLELKLSFKRELDLLGATHATHTQARKELLATVGSAMQRKSITIIASSRSDSSIHKSLRNCGLFDQPVQVTTPDAERRETLIREMLVMKASSIDSSSKARPSRTVTVDPAIDFGFLSSLTEGYSVRDLSSATDRAFHQMLKRYTLFQSSEEAVDVQKLQQIDFAEGLKNFQPTALIGVDLFKSSVKWSDVGGLQSVRTVLKDTLELPTRYSKLYENSPIKLPAGMLLYGPPGCGKTLLASAVAHECGLNFISVKGPEVLNKYIGASEQAIRDLFARAASASPSVLFLDEFDSIAPRRGADNTGVTDRLVNQLLTFLDGVEGRKVCGWSLLRGLAV